MTDDPISLEHLLELAAAHVDEHRRRGFSSSPGADHAILLGRPQWDDVRRTASPALLARMRSDADRDPVPVRIFDVPVFYVLEHQEPKIVRARDLPLRAAHLTTAGIDLR